MRLSSNSPQQCVIHVNNYDRDRVLEILNWIGITNADHIFKISTVGHSKKLLDWEILKTNKVDMSMRNNEMIVEE